MFSKVHWQPSNNDFCHSQQRTLQNTSLRAFQDSAWPELGWVDFSCCLKTRPSACSLPAWAWALPVPLWKRSGKPRGLRPNRSCRAEPGEAVGPCSHSAGSTQKAAAQGQKTKIDPSRPQYWGWGDLHQHCTAFLPGKELRIAMTHCNGPAPLGWGKDNSTGLRSWRNTRRASTAPPKKDRY